VREFYCGHGQTCGKFAPQQPAPGTLHGEDDVRIVLSFIAVAAAALIPMAASRAGVSVFWSQAIGIGAGSLLLYLVIVPETDRKKVFVSWAIAMTIATFIVLGLRHVRSREDLHRARSASLPHNR
jgi:uncharacterized membrane protein